MASWNVIANDGQLSFDNMDVPPIEIKEFETLQDRIEKSYRAIRLAAEMSMNYYKKPLVCCVSGGKDSTVITRLCEECLEPHQWECMNSHTTVDAPQTVMFIQNEFKRLREKGVDCWYKNRYPVENTMWDLILQRKFPPTRIVRYCCSVLKETGTKNRIAILGVRSDESASRAGREIFSIRGVQSKVDFFFA